MGEFLINFFGGAFCGFVLGLAVAGMIVQKKKREHWKKIFKGYKHQKDF